ncbi:hypothetical protein P879_10565 [Paragonimus westermani]|uniref:Protein kinase domain-containing protein n=1 Tax=Paragonimus westermani TaxID=34504 RepID=A0A8T0D128_9TREM|nr:hypothetical protein P879_10565 [Paragonimus westermani]
MCRIPLHFSLVSFEADASLSTFLTEDVDVELVCCNPIFCAPELLTSRKFDKAYDLWSLGVLLYIMLSGCDPYYPKSNGDLYRAILTGDIQFPDNLWNGISRTGRDAAKQLLVLDTNQRHTTAQLLKHTWLTDDHIMEVHLAATQKRLEEFRLKRQEMVSYLLTVTGSNPSEAQFEQQSVGEEIQRTMCARCKDQLRREISSTQHVESVKKKPSHSFRFWKILKTMLNVHPLP